MFYYAILEAGSETEAYGIRFPDLPAVFSASDDVDDITSNAMEALELWAEDEDMPQPSTLSEINAMPAVKEALAQGCALIRVPFIQNVGKSVQIAISMDKGTNDAIGAEAKRRGLTKSAYISQAAIAEMKRGA